ncbi:hypothetical protein [Mucilaginibacter lappiensis]|uniref:hypothetical protein n=1 Tax=Mucilaginibacter lappiensis TaxID=354630 RepID=UPI003D203E75
MKNLNTFYFLIILFILSSCKKDHTPVKPIDPDSTDSQIAAVSDSVSYTIDGKTYIANIRDNTIRFGNQSVNQKVVFNNNGTMDNFDIIGDKDSVLFYKESRTFSNSTSFSISFIKKFNKKDLSGVIVYSPPVKSILELYAKGKYQYAEDFGRENTENGIAILISANNKTYTSFVPLPLQKPTTLKPGFQNNSSFEIISFIKTENGGYNLEAKFNAIVVEHFNENQKKLENGYLRMYID